MKKYELLKKAYDNYPKATICCWGEFAQKTESTGAFRFEDGYILDGNNFAVYDGKDWAEIVNPKIAVKVENEKEFHALMKYYDGLGYVWEHGEKPNDYKCKIMFPCFVPFETKFVAVSGVNIFPDNKWDDYEIVMFDYFAKEHNIKLPLIKSEDGVWLYDGDEYYRSEISNSKWVLSNYTKDFIITDLSESHSVFHSPEMSKAFSTKQTALDWIEAQKPKEIEIEIGCIKATITKNGVSFDGAIQFIMTDSLFKLTKAIQELS